MNRCLTQEIETADKELNLAYKAVQKTLKPDEKELLRESQRAWLKHTEYELKFIASHWSGGTIAGVRYGQSKYALVKNRVLALQNLINP